MEEEDLEVVEDKVVKEEGLAAAVDAVAKEAEDQEVVVVKEVV